MKEKLYTLEIDNEKDNDKMSWYAAQTWVQYLEANGSKVVILDENGKPCTTPSALELERT